MRMVGISLLPERTEQFVATEMQERRRLLSTATRGWPTPSGDGRRGNFKERRGSRRIFARTNPMFVSIGARSRVLGRASPPRLVPGTRRGPPHASVSLIDHHRVCCLRAALLTSRTHSCLPSRPSAWRERIDLDAIACFDRVIEKSVAHVSSAWRKALTVAATPVNPQIALPVVSTNILTAVLA
jgi:hypothetical protein